MVNIQHTFSSIVDISQLLMESMHMVLDFLSLSWSGIEVYFADYPIVLGLFKVINALNPLYYFGADYSILDLMIGFLIPFLLIFSFVKWLTDLIL